MDKQTAIDLLDNLLGMVEDNHDSDYDTAIKMGIDAIKEKTQLSEEDATKDATFDYIDRQAAIDSVCEYCEYYKNEKLIQTIKDLSSAQPEIIRCKDCKYWMRAYLSISGKHGCNVMRDYTAPDDYCFKAERKA